MTARYEEWSVAFLSHTHTILRPIDEIVPGTELAGKYKIIDVVGKGGMGIVFKAEDIKLKFYDSDHFIPKTEMIKETLAWLDKYLGPVK